MRNPEQRGYVTEQFKKPEPETIDRLLSHIQEATIEQDMITFSPYLGKEYAIHRTPEPKKDTDIDVIVASIVIFEEDNQDQVHKRRDIWISRSGKVHSFTTSRPQEESSEMARDRSILFVFSQATPARDEKMGIFVTEQDILDIDQDLTHHLRTE